MQSLLKKERPVEQTEQSSKLITASVPVGGGLETLPGMGDGGFPTAAIPNYVGWAMTSDFL